MKNDKENKPSFVRIEDLAQLNELIAAPTLARVLIDGLAVEIPVSRMSHATSERTRALYRKARPPFNPKLNAGQGGYDEMAPEYQSEQARNEAIARSVTIYLHCPLVQKQSPGLQDDQQMHELVSKLFPEVILNALALTIRASGTQIDLERLQERVNFT